MEIYKRGPKRNDLYKQQKVKKTLFIGVPFFQKSFVSNRVYKTYVKEFDEFDRTKKLKKMHFLVETKT